MGKSIQEQLTLAHENFAAWIFSTHADKYHKIAVADEHQSLTYGQLKNHVEQFAGHLHSQGFIAQQRLVISMDDSVAWPVVFLGALYVGLNPVLVSNVMTHKDIERIIQISDAVAIVSDQQHDWSITCIDADTVFDYRGQNFTEFYRYHADEPCLWLLSSGSTGEPKCIVNRHANLHTLMCLVAPSAGIDQDSQILSTAKMSWTYGFNVSITFCLGAGGTAHVLSGPPAPSKIFNMIKQRHITHLWSVPSVLVSMCKHKKFNLSSNLKVFSSGEPLPLTTTQYFLNEFDIQIYNVFGMSETTQIYCMQTAENWEIGTIGQPLPGVLCELRNENNQIVPVGEVGEIYVSSPCQASMYWKDWQKTRNTFYGNWVRTGDKAIRNQNGNLIFLGRQDELIKIKGLYVSPFEIESAFTDLPEVEECTVVHANNMHGLAELYAFVVVNNPVSEDYVRSKISQSIANYKIPKHIKFVDNLPKTLTNKKIRSTLRKEISCD